jgi:hypothetical protein
MVSRKTVESWIAAYERAWRTEGTETLSGIFSEGASYRMSPYEDPVIGLAAIGRLWESEREGPDEEFEISHEIVAVEADTAVVRVAVEYGRGTSYRDLWIARFAGDGRCREFEEWPFWPEKPIVSYEGDGR